MPPGLTTASFSVSPRSATKSQAARSAIVFDRVYGVRSRLSGSVQSASVSGVEGLAGVADRRYRGGDDDAFDPRVEAGAEHAQGSLAGGDDQLVRILRLDRRERRSDVENVVAALDRVRPVLVLQ